VPASTSARQQLAFLITCACGKQGQEINELGEANAPLCQELPREKHRC